MPLSGSQSISSYVSLTSLSSPLCSKSTSYLRVFIRQLLNEFFLDCDVWEDIIMVILSAIARDLPSVLQIIHDLRSNPSLQDIHHYIHVVYQGNDFPSRSSYLPGWGEAHETWIPSSLVKERPQLAHLGGVVYICSPPKDFEPLKLIVEFVVFAVCASYLEIQVYTDHLVERKVYQESPPSLASKSHNASLSNLKSAIVGFFRRDSASKPPLPPKDPPRMSGYFASAIHKLESMVISTSPYVRFLPPFLLCRLTEDEAKQIEKSNVTSMKRGVSVYSFDLPANGIATIDSRIGLRYFALNPTYLSILRHQSISFTHYLYHPSDTRSVCTVPLLRSVEYYARKGEYRDPTVKEFFIDIVENASRICKTPWCKRPLSEHIYVYLHFSSKVEIRLAPSDYTCDEISFFYGCGQCQERSPSKSLSQGSMHSSLGKFLELLVYDRKFTWSPLCGHSDFTRNYLFNSMQINLSISSIVLYEMRSTKFEACGSDAYWSGTDGIYHGFSSSELKEEAVSDIKAFFTSIRDYLITHAISVKGEDREMIEDLIKNAYLEESALLEMLCNNLDFSNFSDFRRKMTDIMDAFVATVATWIEEFLPKAPLPTPRFPEYHKCVLQDFFDFSNPLVPKMSLLFRVVSFLSDLMR